MITIITQRPGQNAKILDISYLVGKITWSGELKKAPRKLSFDYYFCNGYRLEKWDIIIAKDGSKELFRGIVLNMSFTSSMMSNVTCYDFMYYWPKNKDSFTFKNQTASSIFSQICSKFGVNGKVVHSSSFVIKELIEKNKSAYDIMCQVMSITYKNTSKRYYIRDYQGQAQFIERAKQTHEWILSVGENIMDYSYSISAEDTFSKVKLMHEDSKDKKKILISQASNTELIKKFGVAQYFETVSDNVTQGALDSMAAKILKEKSSVKEKFSISALGINDIIAGDMVRVSIPILGICKSYYVEKDTHSYDSEIHTMNLNLSIADGSYDAK